MLILLTTSQRPQIIKALSIDNMQASPGAYKFVIDGKDLKQGRPGYKPERLVLRTYPCDRRLCVHNYLSVYLQKTLDFRGKNRNLILTTKKPFKPATTNTVSRWVKTVLNEAGVDTDVYKPGSTRMAAASKAKRGGVPLDEILKQGGWTRRTTFADFYDRPINVPSKDFGKVVLN